MSERHFGITKPKRTPGTGANLFPPRLNAKPDLELHVEIGCNAGHVIVEWAKQNPQRAYIGIDWKFKPIFRGVEKGLKRGLDNLIFFRAHADRLKYMFGESEIDRLSLFFLIPGRANRSGKIASSRPSDWVKWREC